MNIIIHRGTHQIGGSVVEINTKTTRIIIDMGDELSLETHFMPRALMIDGVTEGMLIVMVFLYLTITVII